MSDTITRLNKALEGRYSIRRELGEGGMATVYLADDLRHDRKVAIKVLKPELAAVVGAERFLAEIKTTAGLQHPHVLPLHDSGEADGFLFYVMPYIEGDTLRDRLERDRQLPVDEAVRIAQQVASALDYAHEKGIVHRDIKPANILLSRGEPVVADFGIALAVSAAGGGRLTETGLSLGTPHYMSPEQAVGDERVGPSSDIYALGCVLYEMLVGEPPYTGSTAQAVLGRIITAVADPVTEHRKAVPPNVDAAVRRALEKLPADRFHTAGEFADALERSGFTHETVGARPVHVPSGTSVWKIATGILAATTVGLAVMYMSGPPSEEERSLLRYELMLPVEIGANSDWGSNIAISSDGQSIAYSGMHEGAETPGLWVRRRDRIEPIPLGGTAFGVHPTFSPDGTRVAFISDDRALKVASLEGRPTVTLYQDPFLRRSGVSWGDDGYIYFSHWEAEGGPSVLHRIRETGGGGVEQVTRVDTARDEVAHYFPDVLPGSEWVLLTIARTELYNANTREIGIANIETGEVTALVDGMQAIWSETGHLLVVRGDGALVAATWNEGSGVGPMTPIFEGVQVESLASADFAVSESGTLVYVPGGALGGSSPVWVDRTGLDVPVDPSWKGGLISDPRISPDGTAVAFTRNEGTRRHVWIKELDTGPESTLSAEGSINVRPTWTPDGRAVAFVSNRDGANNIYLRVADGSLPSERIATFVDGVRNLDEVAFSPDGRWVVVQLDDDIYVRSTEPDAELTPLLAEPGVIEGNFAISPDGRWIAYGSTETGEAMVYVRPFPNVDAGRSVVSTRPARAPRWSPDMNELYYRTLDGDLVAAEISAGTRFAVVGRTPLFSYRGFWSSAAFSQYDVHPDGDRFLMIRLGDAAGRTPIRVVEGFHQELEQAMGR